MANAEFLLANAAGFMSDYYDLDFIPVEARFGNTARHITRSSKLVGDNWHKKCFDVGFSRTRVSTDLEADMPDAGVIGMDDIYVNDSHLRQLAGTVLYSIPAGKQVDGSETAAIALAKQYVAEVEADMGERRNQLIHAGADPRKALVSAVYADNGTAYATSSDAFVKVKTGSPVAFGRGEIVDFINPSGGAIRMTGKINDVQPGPLWLGLAVGPGFSVSIDATENAGAADFDTLVADDYIRRHDDSATGGFPAAFASLCPTAFASALSYFSVTDRRTKTYRYLLPNYRDYSEGGAAVELDIESHLGAMSDTLSYILGKVRANRRAREFKFSDALVAVTRPEIIRYATNQAGNPYKRFTATLARDIPSAERQKLIAVYGWNGLIINLPNLPPIALEADQLAEEEAISVYDPSAFEWLQLGDDKNPWLPGEIGGKWSLRRSTSTGNRTLKYDASAVRWETLFNESPVSSFYQVRGVKHAA